MIMFTQEDLRSPCWRKIKEHCEAELAQLRVDLESDLEPVRTAKVRGQIRTHVLLLALGNAPTLAIVEEEPE